MSGRLTALACDAHQRILGGTDDGRIFEWTLGVPEPRRVCGGLEGSAVLALWTSSGGLVRTGTAVDGRVAVWDGPAGQLAATLHCERPVKQCVPAEKGRYLLLEDTGLARLWSPGETLSDPILDKPGRLGRYGRAGVSDGLIVLLTSFRWTVWNAATGKEQDRHTALDGMDLNNVDGLTGLSDNGRYYFIYWDDYSVFDTREKRRIRSLRRPMEAVVAALSDDGSRLIVGAESGRVAVIEPEGRLLTDVHPWGAPITQVAVNADGSVAAFLDAKGQCGGIDATSSAGQVFQFPVLERPRS